MKIVAIVLASGLAFTVPAFADSVTTTTTQSGGAVVVTPPAVMPPAVAVAPSETKTYDSTKTTDDGQVDTHSKQTVTPFGSSTTTTKTIQQNDD